MPTNPIPHITGGELDNDPDTDARPNDLLKGQQGYVGDQTALVAALQKELTAGGAPIAAIQKYLPILQSVADGLLAVFVPGAAPVAHVVGQVIQNAAASL